MLFIISGIYFYSKDIVLKLYQISTQKEEADIGISVCSISDN